MENNILAKIKGGLFGVAVGDALGVPVEFMKRENLKNEPVVTMQNGGIHHQKTGTWSDDSSLTFCLAESLCNGYNVQDIAENMVKWFEKGYWTPHGHVFDIGISTRMALRAISAGTPTAIAGGNGEKDNGNGSLMRILPLAYYLLHEENREERMKTVFEVSSITHGHIISKMACYIYIELAIGLLQGLNFEEANRRMQTEVQSAILQNADYDLEVFRPLVFDDVTQVPEIEIKSSGFVAHTLTASIWSIKNTSSYKEAVLKAVNLGDDTDTTAAVTGGLAGILYGFESIPAEWFEVLAKKEKIEDLCDRFASSII